MIAFLTILAALGSAQLSGQSAAPESLSLPVAHRHLFGSCSGTLAVTGTGVAFQHTGDKGHNFQWTWRQIQQLDLTRYGLTVLSYHDRELLLGSDQPFEFRFASTPDVRALYSALALKMDQRLSARVALPPEKPLWRIPVKRLRKINPVEGELIVESSRILFVASAPGESRVWRDSDIVNISTSGPFSLAIATHEKGGDFDLQLRQSLNPAHYDALWKRLNRPQGLELISTSKEHSHQ